MPTFKVTRYFTVSDTVIVDAEDKDDAIFEAVDMSLTDNDDWNYVPHSMVIGESLPFFNIEKNKG